MPVRKEVEKWVAEMSALCQPDRVIWCDGSEEERERLTEECVEAGELIRLNQDKLPGCYLHRSSPTDVARTEHLTFICTPTKDEVGPTNNWWDPAEARAKLTTMFRGCMKGRTMYVVPFLMGPLGSPFSKLGVEITDSRYVVLNMRIMTRMGDAVWLNGNTEFTRCMHSIGDLSPERRYICHFPQDNEVMSFGSGYGGNALLGKKCLALRIASYLGRQQGWLAEHMLIVGLKNPEGEIHYVCGAFPSACGKTNLAMMVPPPRFREAGWEVFTVGDDIAWLRPGEDGRLWAINPEAGFFGVVPGTSTRTNTNAMKAIAANTIYTNVALRKDGTVWWEGHDDPPDAEGMLDWQGRPWKPGTTDKAAHPNARFTAPASQNPAKSPHWEDVRGVPISAILFGARRQRTVPLVFESFDWQHGTFLGATLSSEGTAAAADVKQGVIRRDPMAMIPFCGYNMADYWRHWLEVGSKLTNPPKIYRVNWFRTDRDGKFMWPGFGENLRVMAWVLDRCAGRTDAADTEIGRIPLPDGIDTSGLSLAEDAMDELLRVDRHDWLDAVDDQRVWFEKFGDRLPTGIRAEHEALQQRVTSNT
jgi:phosphoenolpyruvate carboxykinase (GTP)